MTIVYSGEKRSLEAIERRLAREREKWHTRKTDYRIKAKERYNAKRTDISTRKRTEYRIRKTIGPIGHCDSEFRRGVLTIDELSRRLGQALAQTNAGYAYQ